MHYIAFLIFTKPKKCSLFADLSTKILSKDDLPLNKFLTKQSKTNMLATAQEICDYNDCLFVDYVKDTLFYLAVFTVKLPFI